MTTITIDETTWSETYKPVNNHIDPLASCGGAMFETFGDELAYVQSMIPTNRVWTYCDGDEGELLIASGYSFVNRIGYFITEVPWTEHTIVEID